MAPAVASIIDRRSKLPAETCPHPIRVPIKPPINAPRIPSNTVMMQPDGSRPGTRNFARVPATRPSKIQ